MLPRLGLEFLLNFIAIDDPLTDVGALLTSSLEELLRGLLLRHWRSDLKGVQKRIATQKGQTPAKERMREYRSAVFDQEQTECTETIGHIIRAR